MKSAVAKGPMPPRMPMRGLDRDTVNIPDFVQVARVQAYRHPLARQPNRLNEPCVSQLAHKVKLERGFYFVSEIDATHVLQRCNGAYQDHGRVAFAVIEALRSFGILRRPDCRVFAAALALTQRRSRSVSAEEIANAS
jgi:hypothetical protein